MIRPASSARLRPLCLLLLASIAGAAFGQTAKRPPNPVFAPVSDVPGLPRVLLIGDSISIGYTLAVRRLIEGQANLHRIPENGGPTIRGVEKIDAWLGDGHWEIIHFNFGLHDLKIMDTGKHQVPIGEYERNMERIVGRLKKTGAKLIWAPTTPVPEGDLRPRSSKQCSLFGRSASAGRNPAPGQRPFHRRRLGPARRASSQNDRSRAEALAARARPPRQITLANSP